MQRPNPEDSNRDMPDLINFLKANNYTLVNNGVTQFGSRSTATFSKIGKLAEGNGTAINDATIVITIDFDRRFDYKNARVEEADSEGPISYNYDHFTEDSVLQFINKLRDGTYDPAPVQQGAPTNAGKRKGRTTKRKTRKNKRR